ncbi:hypothetical protein, partial [Stutzerimonas nitrititolerans]|uniref:hypothetical protein n=1 Tax=Stutzerimonas nitrititolerans TaxID=2482751 RepID=UPI0028987C2E
VQSIIGATLKRREGEGRLMAASGWLCGCMFDIWVYSKGRHCIRSAPPVAGARRTQAQFADSLSASYRGRATQNTANPKAVSAPSARQPEMKKPFNLAVERPLACIGKRIPSAGCAFA